MPAIQPARLKIQVTLLVEQFEHPENFCVQLHDLLSHYANRTYRAGETGQIRQLTPSYDPPIPVLRQVKNELKSVAYSNPEKALNLADALWLENWWEFRLLAGFLLGQIAPSNHGAIFDRLNRWLVSTTEPSLADLVSQAATEKIRSEQPALLLEWVNSIIEKPVTRGSKYVFHILAQLVQHPAFENIPAVIRIVSPFVRKSPSEIRMDVLQLIEDLISRSPNEVLYLFRQSLESQENLDTGWYIRKSTARFPEELRFTLQELLRNNKSLRAG